jgi:hypothetical protein
MSSAIDKHPLSLPGDNELVDALLRLKNLVGKPGHYKVPGGPELKFTILAVIPPASLPAEMDNEKFCKDAISYSTFRIQLDAASVDGEDIIEILGCDISDINDGYY